MSAVDPRLIGQRRTGPDRKLDPMKEFELISDYLGSLKLKDMQEKYGISKMGIYGVLKRHGVERDGRKVAPASDTGEGRGDTPTQQDTPLGAAA
jgi:hypothetical protein